MNSRLAFAASCVFAGGTVVLVHYLQRVEGQTRRIGIERDDLKRQALKDELKKRELEAVLQDKLHQKLILEQPIATTVSSND
jgi:hypothetical protein